MMVNVVLYGLALILLAVIFAIDVHVPLTVAVGVLYSLVIFYSWLLPGLRTSMLFASICSLLIIVAAVSGPNLDTGGQTRAAGLNVLIEIIAIWITAILVLIAKFSLQNLELSLESLEDKVQERTAELMKSQKQFERSQNRYKQLLETAPDAVVIVDDLGKIQFVNHLVEEVFGYTKAELLDENVSRLLPQGLRSGHDANIQRFVASPRVREMGQGQDLCAERKSGEIFPVEISLSPVEVEDGLLISASIRDVSERKAAQDAMNRYAKRIKVKNKELEQFVYIASHDLQEPLRTMSSCVARFEKELQHSLNDRQKKYLQFINEASQRACALVTCLLEYGRIGRSGDRVTVDCDKVLDQIVADLDTQINDSRCKIKRRNLPVIQGFETEIRSLFQNLLTNAIKFQNPEVSPEIKVSAEKLSENKYRFCVSDNGIGIERKHQEKVFQIFQRLHAHGEYEGMGIGLAHAKKIVELHDGDIWFESEPGEGCTFYFTVTGA